MAKVAFHRQPQVSPAVSAEQSKQDATELGKHMFVCDAPGQAVLGCRIELQVSCCLMPVCSSHGMAASCKRMSVKNDGHDTDLAHQLPSTSTHLQGALAPLQNDAGGQVVASAHPGLFLCTQGLEHGRHILGGSLRLQCHPVLVEELLMAVVAVVGEEFDDDLWQYMSRVNHMMHTCCSGETWQ